jgi:hypothetical protein
MSERGLKTLWVPLASALPFCVLLNTAAATSLERESAAATSRIT